jgi:cytochrome c
MLVAGLVAACATAQEPGPMKAADDADAALVALGRDVFAQCDGCHLVERDASSSAGPNLFGIVGRRAGSLRGYPYTDALVASQVTWDAASLDAYLADPSGFIPGSEMERGTVRDPELRAAVIAYLSSVGG